MLKKWLKDSNKFALVVFAIVWLSTFIALINAIVIGDWFKISMVLAALVLFEAPLVITTKFKITLPVLMEIIYYLFIFGALTLGEVFAFYGLFRFWDIILHFLSGFMLACIGLSLVEILGKNKSSKILTLLFAFCFSMTLGIIWECLEFTFDMTVHTDTQKDAHLHSISTITMQTDGGNHPVWVDNIVNTEIHLANGETITIDDGYLDVGLIDTMKDIFVNTAGASLFCIVGAFYLKDDQKQNSFAKKFIPTKK